MAVVLAVAGVAWLAWFGEGAVGYDPLWALVWGDELAHGHAPSLEASPITPTPHPLATFVSAPLSLAGAHAFSLLLILSALALGLLAWTVFRMGDALFGTAVGVVAAAIVVTRPLIVNEALQGMVDIPFLAMIAWAVALEAERPRRGPAVLVTLGLAGLIRPEAWLLAAAYAVYLGWEQPARARLAIAAAALAAPLVWMAADLWATGDPLYSLHGTQELASLLGRPREAGAALRNVSPFLGYILDGRVAIVGFAGALGAAFLLYPRAVLPSVLLWLGLAGFLALGVAHLPVLIRYLLVPSIMLAVFVGVAVAGWSSPEAPAPARKPWMAAGAIALVVLLAGIGRDRDGVREVRAFVGEARTAHDAVRDLTARPAFRDAARRCPTVVAEGFRAVPSLAYLLHRDPSTVALAPQHLVAPGQRALLVLHSGTPPPGTSFRTVARNDVWAAYARC